MTEETRIRVRLDTQGAKQQLAGLVREGARTAGRVSSTLRTAVGRGLGAAGLGGAFAAGASAVRGATQGGVTDVAGEAFGGIGAQLAEAVFGSLDEEARASKAARDETIQAFGAIAGARGAIPPGARQFFESVKSLRVQEERGRELFERDEQFRGPGVGELIDRILTGIGKLLSDAVDNLISKIPFVGSK